LGSKSITIAVKVYQNSSHNMGTRFNLLLPGIDASEGEKLFISCTRELDRLENMLSCFIGDSEISMINEKAYENAIEVNSELFMILEDCQMYCNITQGAFDISLGKIIDKWKINTKSIENEPVHAEPEPDKIILNSENKTVAFTSPTVKINMGGYGKGYALSKIRNLLLNFDISSAFISFGDSSVSTIGKHPYGDYWQLGIMDHYDNDKSIEILRLDDESISTSGNLNDPNHIIDPANGLPAMGEKTITVKSKDAITSEVLSTALMIMDANQKTKMLQDLPGIDVVEVNYLNKQAEVLKYSST